MWTDLQHVTVAQFLDALRRPHTPAFRFDVLRGGVPLGTVEVAGGVLECNARATVRRTLELTVPDELWPDEATDPLSPYSCKVQAWRGIDWGTGWQTLVPVFTGRVWDIDDAGQGDGSLTVRCEDRAADLAAAEFESPLPPTSGERFVDLMARAIRTVRPAAVVHDRSVSDAVVPGGVMLDGNVARALDELAKTIGCQWYADRLGNYVIAPIPVLDGSTTPLVTFANGVDGTIVRAGRTQSREGVANQVVVIAERPGNDVPLRGVARDETAGSPTRWDGDFGRCSRTVRVDGLTTQAQADDVAALVLADSLGLLRDRHIEAVPNPLLDEADPAGVVFRGPQEIHLADRITMPMVVSSEGMTVSTRASRRA